MKKKVYVSSACVAVLVFIFYLIAPKLIRLMTSPSVILEEAKFSCCISCVMFEFLNILLVLGYYIDMKKDEHHYDIKTASNIVKFESEIKEHNRKNIDKKIKKF